MSLCELILGIFFFVVIRNMKLFVMLRIKVNQNFFGLWWSKSLEVSIFGDFLREDVCVCVCVCVGRVWEHVNS